MEWALLSILGAFGQALGWGLKKKALNQSGVNNLTGFVGYSAAGMALTLLYFFLGKGGEAHLTTAFWVAIFLSLHLMFSRHGRVTGRSIKAHFRY